MPWLVLLVVAVMGLNHWLMEPLLKLGTGLFEGRSIGWLLLGVVVWITAGSVAPKR
ncbi:hypothetical protein [Vulcanococcus limneticus]|uniref:hypothetical protein n=1 Tax=Vulcanococcus limneticus TaxID=2170428 RepID=UPI00398BEDCF